MLTISSIMDKLSPRIRAIFHTLASTVCLSVFSKIGHLLLTVFLARSLGPEGLGLFTLAIGVALVVGTGVGLGIPAITVRFWVVYKELKQYHLIKGFIASGIGAICLASFPVIVVGFWAPYFIDFQNLDKLYAVQVGLILAPILAVRKLYRRIFVAEEKVALGIILDEVIIPYSFIISAFILISLEVDNLQNYFFLYIGISILILIFGSIFVLRYLKRNIFEEALISGGITFEIQWWLKSSLSALTGQLSKLMVNKSDVIILGLLVSAQNIGDYAAAFKLTYIMTFFPVVINAIYSSRASKLWHDADYLGFQRLMFEVRLIVASILLPILIVVFLFSEYLVLYLFGSEFSGSILLLKILVVGQFFAGISVTSMMALLAQGREKYYGSVNVMALMAVVLGGWFATIQYGVVGLAWVTTSVFGLIAFGQTYYSQKNIKC